jgi:hypothetical protein
MQQGLRLRPLQKRRTTTMKSMSGFALDLLPMVPAMLFLLVALH